LPFLQTYTRALFQPSSREFRTFFESAQALDAALLHESVAAHVLRPSIAGVVASLQTLLPTKRTPLARDPAAGSSSTVPAAPRSSSLSPP
jgi:hypothetical protein